MPDNTQVVRRSRNAGLRVLSLMIGVFALSTGVGGTANGEPAAIAVAGLWLVSAGLLWWVAGWRPGAPTGGEDTAPYRRAALWGGLAVALFLVGAVLAGTVV